MIAKSIFWRKPLPYDALDLVHEWIRWVYPIERIKRATFSFPSILKLSNNTSTFGVQSQASSIIKFSYFVKSDVE